MQPIDLITTFLGIGTAAVGAIVWLVRLEGRINTEAALRASLDSRLNGFESRIWDKLDNIEKLIHQKADRE